MVKSCDSALAAPLGELLLCISTIIVCVTFSQSGYGYSCYLLHQSGPSVLMKSAKTGQTQPCD